MLVFDVNILNGVFWLVVFSRIFYFDYYKSEIEIAGSIATTASQIIRIDFKQKGLFFLFFHQNVKFRKDSKCLYSFQKQKQKNENKKQTNKQMSLKTHTSFESSNSGWYFREKKFSIVVSYYRRVS